MDLGQSQRYVNTTGSISGAGTAYPSGAPEFTPGFQWDSCCSIFCFLCNVLQITVCPFVLFHLPIVFSVRLPFTDSDYPFGIFKLFLWCLVLQTNMASVALRLGRQIQRLHRHRVSRDTDNPLHYFRLDRDITVTQIVGPFVPTFMYNVPK